MDITTIAQDVRALMAAEGLGLIEDVGVAEQRVREKVLAIGQAVLREHFAGRKPAYQGEWH